MKKVSSSVPGYTRSGRFYPREWSKNTTEWTHGEFAEEFFEV